MVIIALTGGLGNQLFQYAFGRALTFDRKNELYFDLEMFTWDPLRDFSLDKFHIPYKISSAEERDTLKVRKSTLPFISKYITPYYKSTNIEELTFEYDPNFNKYNRKNCYYKGYWQTARYFSSIRAVILSDLKLSKPISVEADSYLNAIKSTKQSISIHIRRGDYLKDSKTNNYHGVLPFSYYTDAIAYMESFIEEPTYYIFSDDKDFVKATFGNKENYIFIENIKYDYEELFLMSQCNHNIIANSSFSWWGAWLNETIDKCVVSPKQWFKNKDMQLKTKDLVPHNWIKL